jgi:hypothetical protein
MRNPMRCVPTSLSAALLWSATQAATAAPTPPALSASDQAGAYSAAGYKRKGKQWRLCDDPTPNYSPGQIEPVGDLNGDGQPEAVINEGSTFCHGRTGNGYSLVSRQADGRWTLIASGTGMVSFLKTKGSAAWPDMQIGGPGFCFPVERWNAQAKAYRLHRWEYDGKRCKPPR